MNHSTEIHSSNDGSESQASSKQWLLYVLKCADGTLYTGITNDIVRRIRQHNTGKGAKYTRSRGPCEIVDTCEFPDRSTSSKAEYKFKKLNRKQKLQALESGLRRYLLPPDLDADHHH